MNKIAYKLFGFGTVVIKENMALKSRKEEDLKKLEAELG